MMTRVSTTALTPSPRVLLRGEGGGEGLAAFLAKQRSHATSGWSGGAPSRHRAPLAALPSPIPGVPGRGSRALALILCLIAFLSSVGRAAEHRVASAAEIERAARNARPGDVLVMKEGPWQDQKIIFTASGNENQPVTLRAQTPGKVILSGKSSLRIDGDYLVVSGLLFSDVNGEGDLISIKGNGNRFTESAIIAPNRGGKWVHFDGGGRNRLDHCYLEGHAPEDVTVQVEVDKATPNEHRIDHNHFGPRPPLGKNGGETIRIGYSHQSMSNSRTVVEDNLFDRCDGEIEIISSKSCENVFRGNTFRDSEGCLTLRHGNRCIVEANFFLGNGPADGSPADGSPADGSPADGNGGGKPTGGVRVIGEDHVIRDNYFETTSGIAGGVIVLTTGQPNAELTGYWHITKATITGNTFVHNTAPVIHLSGGLGQKNRSLLPMNVTIADNVMVPPPSKATPLIVGKQGENFTWEGNVAPAGVEVGAAPPDAIKLIDLKMTRGEDGLWRREGEKPRAGKLLTPADVGPAWRKADQDGHECCGRNSGGSGGPPAGPNQDPCGALCSADCRIQ